MWQHLDAQVHDALTEGGDEVDNFRLENIDRRVSAPARRMGDLFMHLLNDTVLVKDHDAATLRPIGIKGHHCESGISGPCVMACNEGSDVKNAEVVGVYHHEWLLCEERPIAQYCAACSQQLLLVRQRNLAAPPRHADELPHLLREVVSVDKSLFDAAREQHLEPIVQ